MYHIGMQVSHSVFGNGRISCVNTETIEVVFQSGKRCNFMKSNCERYLTVIAASQSATSSPKIIDARTNAEFLNIAFGTDYKEWMRCGWDYDDNTIVWMIPFDDKVRNGWRNSIVDDCTVREDFVGDEREMLGTHQILKKYRRIVVKKEQKLGRYIILGLYTFDFENSEPLKRRIWKKISEDIFGE